MDMNTWAITFRAAFRALRPVARGTHRALSGEWWLAAYAAHEALHGAPPRRQPCRAARRAADDAAREVAWLLLERATPEERAARLRWALEANRDQPGWREVNQGEPRRWHYGPIVG